MYVCMRECVRAFNPIDNYIWHVYRVTVKKKKKGGGGKKKWRQRLDDERRQKNGVPSVFHRFFHEKGHKEGSPKEYLSNFSLDFFPSFSLPLILYFIYPINASIPLVKGCVLKELFRINVFFFLPFFFSNSPLRGELSTFELSRSAVLLTY